MNILSVLLCFLLLIAVFDKQIKKYSGAVYVFCILLSIIGIILPKDSGMSFINYFNNQLLKRGTLAGALFILVMYAPVFPFYNNIRVKLLKLRGELAIMAASFSLVHNIVFGKKYFILLLTDINKLKTFEIIAAVISLIMIFLLIPLTITSFIFIRKKMNPKKWKNLQKLSYLFYALLYLHIIILFSKGIFMGKSRYFIDFIIYTLIYGIYLMLRIAKCVKQNKTKNATLIKNQIIISNSIIIILMTLILIFEFSQFGKNLDNEIYNSHNASVENISNADTLPSNNSDVENKAVLNEAGGYLNDGIYEGKAPGYNGNVYVSVTLKDQKIVAIEVTKHVEDEDYYYDAKDKVISDIIETQSTDVDIVSGSTTTSEAIMKAVKKALNGKY